MGLNEILFILPGLNIVRNGKEKIRKKRIWGRGKKKSRPLRHDLYIIP